MIENFLKLLQQESWESSRGFGSNAGNKPAFYRKKQRAKTKASRKANKHRRK